MRIQTKSKTKTSLREATEMKKLLPVLANLIESGKIVVRLGSKADLKEFVNDSVAFDPNQIISVDAGGVQIVKGEIQIDLALDDYAS